jgi:hypothetical protein
MGDARRPGCRRDRRAHRAQRHQRAGKRAIAIGRLGQGSSASHPGRVGRACLPGSIPARASTRITPTCAGGFAAVSARGVMSARVRMRMTGVCAPSARGPMRLTPADERLQIGREGTLRRIRGICALAGAIGFGVPPIGRGHWAMIHAVYCSLADSARTRTAAAPVPDTEVRHSHRAQRHGASRSTRPLPPSPLARWCARLPPVPRGTCLRAAGAPHVTVCVPSAQQGKAGARTRPGRSPVQVQRNSRAKVGNDMTRNM